MPQWFIPWHLPSIHPSIHPVNRQSLSISKCTIPWVGQTDPLILPSTTSLRESRLSTYLPRSRLNEWIIWALTGASSSELPSSELLLLTEYCFVLYTYSSDKLTPHQGPWPTNHTIHSAFTPTLKVPNSSRFEKKKNLYIVYHYYYYYYWEGNDRMMNKLHTTKESEESEGESINYNKIIEQKIKQTSGIRFSIV